MDRNRVIEYLQKQVKQLSSTLNELVTSAQGSADLSKAKEAQLNLLKKECDTISKIEVLNTEHIERLQEILNRIQALETELNTVNQTDKLIKETEDEITAFELVIKLLSKDSQQPIVVKEESLIPKISSQKRIKNKITILESILKKHLNGQVAPLDKVLEEFKTSVKVDPGFNCTQFNHYLQELSFTSRQKSNLIIPYHPKTTLAKKRTARGNRQKALLVFYALGNDTLSKKDFIRQGLKIKAFSNQADAQYVIRYIRKNANYPYQKNRLFNLAKTKNSETFSLTQSGKAAIILHKRVLEKLKN